MNKSIKTKIEGVLSRSEMKMIRGGYDPEWPGYKCCNDGDPSNCSSCANSQLQCTGVQCAEGWHCEGVSNCTGIEVN